MSESIATSPIMNDQWSGKILSRTDVRNFDEPKRSSGRVTDLPRLSLSAAAERSATVLTTPPPSAPDGASAALLRAAHVQFPPVPEAGPTGSM